MPEIDIPVSAELQSLFTLTPPASFRLPEVKSLSVKLPTGTSLKAFPDVSKGIPDDAALINNMLSQLGPFLGALDPVMKILKLLKPLVDIIKGLPFPPVKPIKEFIEAAKELIPLFTVPTPANVNLLLFVRDVLCVVLRILRSFIGLIEPVIKTLRELGPRIQQATESGNTELLEALQAAQQNAQLASQHLIGSIAPLAAVLDLAGFFLSLAQIPGIQLPDLSGAGGDVEALDNGIQQVKQVLDTITSIVDGLGGCPQ